MLNKPKNVIAALSGAMLLTVTMAAAFAQAPPPAGGVNRAAQIAQARQANAALMHQYLWQSRVEIIKNGTVKDMRLEQVSYDPNGQLQHTTLNDQGGNKMYLPTPIGFLRRAIADNEKEEMEKYLRCRPRARFSIS